MTPVWPNLRNTENIYLRIALGFERATLTQHHTIEIVHFNDSDRFLHYVNYLTIRTINGVGYPIRDMADSAIAWMEAISK